ncbi:MAG: VOC family protein [Rhizobiaceae bacterium]|nr:VOC family protein [Rhizobiaceae bacterium]
MTFVSIVVVRPAHILAKIVLAALIISGLLNHAQTQGQPAMQVRDLYPLITTPRLIETRDFYVRNFGFEVAFEADWFLYLVGPAEEASRGATLAFMHPNHPSNPPGPESFDGKGMILTVEVSDAANVFERFSEAGAPIVHPLTDEDWGQRRFMTRDPAGVLVDIVQQIEPKAGYWDQYMSK